MTDTNNQILVSTADSGVVWEGPSTTDRSGEWGTASNWDDDAIPDGSTEADVSLPGSYTVDVSEPNQQGNMNVGTLVVSDKHATFDINGGLLFAGPVSNAGIFDVNGGVFQASSFTNTGTLNDDTEINEIGGIGNSGTINVYGELNPESFNNEKKKSNLNIESASVEIYDDASNAGTITVTGHSQLWIDDYFTNTGTLNLEGGSFTAYGPDRNTGTITIGNGVSFEIFSNWTNTGTIDLQSTGSATQFVVWEDLTLSGRGKVILSDSAGNAIVGAGNAKTFTNQTTIEGSGTIGDGNMSLVNGAAGVIDANGTAVAMAIDAATFRNAGEVEVSGTLFLTIDGSFSNTGLIIADDHTTLKLAAGSSLDTVINNGTIELASIGHATDLEIAGNVTIVGSGSVKMAAATKIVSDGVASTLTNRSTIEGAGTIGDAELTVINAAAGTIDATSATADLTIDAASFENAGTLAANGGTLIVDGLKTNFGTLTVDNGGTIELPAASSSPSGTVTNDGTIRLGSTGDNAIVIDGSAPALTNRGTIEGAGTIDETAWMLTNTATGIINADDSTMGLTIDGAASFANAGTMEASSSTLTIDEALTNTGSLGAVGGNLEVTGAVTGTGTATIADNSTLAFDATVATTQTILFGQGDNTLSLGAAQGFDNTIVGFAQGDAIDLGNFASGATKITSITGSGLGDTVITIKDGALTAKIALLNQYSGEYSSKASAYMLISDQHGTTPGTILELAAPVT